MSNLWLPGPFTVACVRRPWAGDLRLRGRMPYRPPHYAERIRTLAQPHRGKSYPEEQMRALAERNAHNSIARW